VTPVHPFGPFVAARVSFWAVFRQPLAPVMVGTFVLGGELGLRLMLAERGTSLGLRLIRGQPLWPLATALGAFSLAWSGLLFMVLGLALSAVQKPKEPLRWRSLCPPLGALGAVGWMTSLGAALAATCLGLALSLMLARGLIHGRPLEAAAWGALSGAPSLLLLGLSTLAGLLAAARLTGGDRAPASRRRGLDAIGQAVADLLASPLDTVAVAGALGLCTAPPLLLSTLAGLAAMWTENAAARTALLCVHGACLGLVLLWLAAGLRSGLDGRRCGPLIQ
jgi:hypothetical protein